MSSYPIDTLAGFSALFSGCLNSLTITTETALITTNVKLYACDRKIKQIEKLTSMIMNTRESVLICSDFAFVPFRSDRKAEIIAQM